MFVHVSSSYNNHPSTFDNNWPKLYIAYIVTEEKSRDIDAITTNLALSDLISNALPDIKPKDATNNKTGLMTIGENVCIPPFKLHMNFIDNIHKIHNIIS